MYNKLHYEVTEEVSKLVTRRLLGLYDKYKDDERIFPKKDKNNIEK